jgi:hypothetical protein
MRNGGSFSDLNELSDPSSDDVVSISGFLLTPAVADFGRVDRLPQLFFSIAPIGAFGADSRTAADNTDKKSPAPPTSEEFQPTPDPDVIAQAIDFSQPRGFKVDIIPPVDTGPLDDGVFTQYDARALLKLLAKKQ